MEPTDAEVILAAILMVPLALGAAYCVLVAIVAAYEDYRSDYKRSRLHPERYNGWWR